MIAHHQKSPRWSGMVFTLALALALVGLTDAQTKSTEAKGGQELLRGRAPVSRQAGRLSPVVKKLDLPEKALIGAAEVGLVSISPNGRKVAFIPDETYRELEVMDLFDGSSVLIASQLRKHTTNQFSIYSFLWSPGGDRLAFTFYPEDARSTNQMISLREVSAAGGTVRTIYESNDARIEPHDWSLDGKWILATLQQRNRRSTDVLIPTDGGSPKPISAGGSKPRLSPDTSFVAFERRQDNRLEVFVSSVEESRQFQVGLPDHENMSPQWSRDGRWLIFKSNRTGTFEFWAQRIENGCPKGEPVCVKPDVAQTARPIQVLNDGRLVYVTRALPSNVYRISVNPETGELAGNPKMITTGRNGVPSKDGRWIAYNSFEFGTGAKSALGLRVISLIGKEERTLATDAIDPYVEGWFPEGNSVLLGGWRGSRGIHRIELASGKMETLFSANRYLSDARLSPDGRWIALAIDSFGPDSQLCVMKAETGSAPRLLRKVAGEGSADPTWSPDGQTIAFASEDRRTGAARILTIPFAGGEARELVRHEQKVPVDYRNGWRWLWQTAWSPNGKFILYARIFYTEPGSNLPAKEEVWMLRVHDGKASVVPELNGYGAFQLHWSADGKELFFSGQEPRRRKKDEYSYWTLENYLPKETHGAK